MKERSKKMILQLMSFGAVLCGVIYQIKTGITRDLRTQRMVVIALAVAYLLLILSK